MLNTLFTVEPDHLQKLDAKEAIDFIAELLWAEARRIGFPRLSHYAVASGWWHGVDAHREGLVVD